MAFDRREAAKPYTPREGDTLRVIAERETALGNPLTWQELARFNWGTDKEREVNAFLRDELGARERDADNNFVISADDVPRGKLLIPVRFELRGLALEKTHTLRVRKKVAPPQFLGCQSLPGITFGFNSSFVRPSVVEHLRPIETLAKAYPDAKIMIFGHTDAVGDDLYNKKLSERRAWSVFAFITNDPDAWETLYDHPDEEWGAPVLREILTELGHEDADDGPSGSLPRAAMRSFLGLSDGAPVQNDAAFRRRLFAEYMASTNDIDLPAHRFMDPGYMGCGEFNPVDATQEEAERNRRVTFFFFHPARLPNLPCAFAATAPCRRQMKSLDQRHSRGFRCSFYDSLSSDCGCDQPVTLDTLRIRLFDPTGAPLTDAPYRLRVGGHVQAGHAGRVGGALANDASWVEALVPDVPERASIEWGHPGQVDPADENATYPYRLELHLHCDAGDEEEQAKKRLHNLGYPSDAALAENVRTFRFEHGLEDGDELSDDTLERLRTVHDHCDPALRSPEHVAPAS